MPERGLRTANYYENNLFVAIALEFVFLNGASGSVVPRKEP